MAIKIHFIILFSINGYKETDAKHHLFTFQFAVLSVRRCVFVLKADWLMQ